MPPQIAEVLTQQGQPIPAGVAGLALIDTGATMTCVHEQILTSLGLNPIGVATNGTANGPVRQNIYPARVVFPEAGWTVDVSQVVGVNLTGQQIVLAPDRPAQPIIALLGRNLLQHWQLVWNGPGGYWTVSM